MPIKASSLKSQHNRFFLSWTNYEWIFYNCNYATDAYVWNKQYKYGHQSVPIFTELYLVSFRIERNVIVQAISFWLWAKRNFVRFKNGGPVTKKDMQTPPPFRNDPIFFWLHMVRNVLNRTRVWIKKISDFYFPSYHRKLTFFSEKWH